MTPVLRLDTTNPIICMTLHTTAYHPGLCCLLALYLISTGLDLTLWMFVRNSNVCGIQMPISSNCDASLIPTESFPSLPLPQWPCSQTTRSVQSSDWTIFICKYSHPHPQSLSHGQLPWHSCCRSSFIVNCYILDANTCCQRKHPGPSIQMPIT